MPNDVAQNASVLLAFRAENVRSFRDEMEFSMLATALAEPRFVREVGWREGGHPLRVLPVAGLFGANASGKSNVLKAMGDMSGYVLHSFRRGNPTGGVQRWPFRLDNEAAQRPSRYEIDIVLNGVRHEYGFVLDDERIIEEWAMRYPRGRAALLFSRTGDKVEVGSAERARTHAVANLLRPNALFLSTAASANHPLLLPLYDWFGRNLLVADSDTRSFRQLLTAVHMRNPAQRERILSLLHAADLSIKDVKMDLDEFDDAVRMLAEQQDGQDVAFADPRFVFESVTCSLVHRGANHDVELATDEESLGTLIWLGLVGPVIEVLARGSVLLADEIEASLHPALVAQLVRLFQEPLTNPNRAQLIFNSHDTTIMGDSHEDRLVGRDQIWFTEKLDDGSTRLYPLVDLDPRKHEAIAKRYLEGRYGATPILSSREFDRVGELIATPD